METLKTAQYVIKTSNSSVACGFNMFVYGYGAPLQSEYSDAYERSQGYEFAKDMARKGDLAFTHRFNCSCGDIPFMYGGFWVCNNCGGKDVDEKWWEIKVGKDGNEFCCHGLDFINLQESNNYAFGKTYEEAIENYGQLMIETHI